MQRVPGAPLRHYPPALRPGDTIAVIAPSSPFEHVLVWAGLGWLGQRYRVRFERGLFARNGYLAGDDDRRLAELTRALLDPDVKAIIAARGGYGVHRFAHRVDWGVIAARPRWLVGFSDITALHNEIARVGLASIHGCHVTALGRGDAQARASFLDILERPLEPRAFNGLSTWVSGSAEGALYGGNLTVLHASAASGRLHVPDGSVLFIEDVTERPYRIDRSLSTLLVGGHFDRLAAVLVGDFTECNPGPDRVTVEDVLRERLSGLGIPVVAGLPVGHALRNEPLILGARARVKAGPESGSVVLSGGP